MNDTCMTEGLIPRTMEAGVGRRTWRSSLAGRSSHFLPAHRHNAQSGVGSPTPLPLRQFHRATRIGLLPSPSHAHVWWPPGSLIRECWSSRNEVRCCLTPLPCTTSFRPFFVPLFLVPWLLQQAIRSNGQMSCSSEDYFLRLSSIKTRVDSLASAVVHASSLSSDLNKISSTAIKLRWFHSLKKNYIPFIYLSLFL